MAHLIGALMSRLIAYFINLCATVFLKIADTDSSRILVNELYGEVLELSKSNMEIIADLEDMNYRMQDALKARCPKNHTVNLLAVDK